MSAFLCFGSALGVGNVDQTVGIAAGDSGGRAGRHIAAALEPALCVVLKGHAVDHGSVRGVGLLLDQARALVFVADIGNNRLCNYELYGLLNFLLRTYR